LEEVEIAVEYCGLCHSDLSIVNDDWGMSQYPVIPGHEAVGKIVALGDYAKGLRIGSANQRGPKSKGADSEASPQVKGDQSNSISGIGSACNSHWVIAS
jgi:NADPH:quinone reductase-like Zn-dependent oxidoreductase